MLSKNMRKRNNNSQILFLMYRKGQKKFEQMLVENFVV